MKAFIIATTLIYLAQALPRPQVTGGFLSAPEKLPMTVLEQKPDYQLVRIPQTKWICSEKQLDTASDALKNWKSEYGSRSEAWEKGNSKTASAELFKKLFRYIAGVNQQRQTVDMTVPVINDIQPMGDAKYKQTMCFWVGSKWEKKTLPTPSSNDIFEMEMPQKEVFISRFGGYVLNGDEWRSHARELTEKLSKDNARFDNEHFYAVGYDAAFIPENKRTNEVWIEKQ